jgi:flagellar hook assembly protein FlgD
VPTVGVNHLAQNYPNPFNPQTTIAFSIKESGRVRIDVYNVAGQLVRTLLDETRAAGSYSDVSWDGTDEREQRVASGVYFYRLTADRFIQTRKMVLVQ